VRHIAPHRWADAALGRLPLDERTRMTAHAAECARCATDRDRVIRARDAFADLGQAAAPELRWEQIGARVYWSTSQERRARTADEVRALVPRRRWLWLAAPATAVAMGVAAAVVVWPDPAPAIAPGDARPVARDTSDTVRHNDDIVPVELVTIDVAVPVAQPIAGLVTLRQGDAGIDGVHGDAVFGVAVVAAQVVTTGADGRIAIQIDDGSAFAVGPGSTVTIARLDRAAVELHVDGEVAVEVTRRPPGQRFVVVAGGRSVEVRGTAFEVARGDGRVEVRCRHGVVAVRDVHGADVVEVGAGARWAAADGDPLQAQRPTPLDAAQLARLTERAPAILPAWTEPEALLRTTAPVAVSAAAGRAVRIDGEPVGRGALTVRVMSGRHLVEAERAPGRWTDGAWITTRDDGTPVEVAIDVPATASDRADRTDRSAAIEARRGELDRLVDRTRVRSCLRSLDKQGLAAGTHVVLHIGVDRTGAVSFLNVGATDLPASAAGCVRDVVSEVSFAAGANASWRHRFSF
jgi:hypothetical protein